MTAVEERRMAGKHSQADALRLVGLAAANQKHLLETSRQLLSTLAQLPEFHKLDGENCGYLVTIMKESPIYTNIGAAKSNAEVFCSAVIEVPVWEKQGVKLLDANRHLQTQP